MHLNTNIPSLRAHGQLLITNREQAKTMRRLSTGFAINSASEAPASHAISNRMRREIDALTSSRQNALDAASIIQTGDRALAEINIIVERIRDLVVQSANETLIDDDRNLLQIEVDELLDEIDRIVAHTTFNGRTLFNGAFTDSEGNVHGNKTVRVGKGENLLMELEFPCVRTSSLARDTGITVFDSTAGIFQDEAGGLTLEILSLDALRSRDNSTTPRIPIYHHLYEIEVDPSTGELIRGDYLYDIDSDGNPVPRFGYRLTHEIEYTGISGDTYTVTVPGHYQARTGIFAGMQNTGDFSTSIINLIDRVVMEVAEIRSRIGAYENRLFAIYETLDVKTEQLSEGLSRIVDTDMALEMARFTQQQVIFQASISVKAMSNQRPHALLALLNF